MVSSAGKPRAETEMLLKTLTVATFGLALAGLPAGQFACAQQQAPIGHRQPTASDVPLNDSVRGDVDLSGQTPDPAPPKKRSRTRRAQSNVDVIMKTPNICSNCNE
jgi:hypothetical protein